MLTISVSIPGESVKEYNIFIGESFDDKQILSLLSAKKTMLIADNKAFEYHKGLLPSILQHSATYIVCDAEKSKNLHEIEKITTWAIENGFDRDAQVVSFGGGAVGDLAGFFASIYMRGVPFIQIPTTLLAQVDASVGGKTAVNACKAKNLIGSFCQPKAVVVHTKVLHSLPERELRSGMAEAMKMGVIASEELFVLTQKSLANGFTQMPDIVAQSVRLKMKIVRDDERDVGKRMWLNLGHTTAHAIESVTNYTSYLHGEAVAFGCIVSANVGHELGVCSNDTVKRVEDAFRHIIANLTFDHLVADDITTAMKYDKKRKGDEIRFIVPLQIGKVQVVDDIDLNIVRKTIEKLIAKYSNV
ncbi:3-dehydroquinate synthase [Candidatus Uabimicrobium amorphum]|uniref:3-dehydroquinate synthase n=1 Tax=Uabimicrobium amorphum TaxID=2596890 RepID=A0A5S9ISA3_UABAM|nr:3-dehydroquinate synthase [Candidatus Uabimicrobium amorphum]BBM87223.1 3-dehydroquinate synthase [Candidatus Uabimicrobium amorphum]